MSFKKKIIGKELLQGGPLSSSGDIGVMNNNNKDNSSNNKYKSNDNKDNIEKAKYI